MGLENYTRGQKIFFAGLIILLASTFTVTGAMIAIFDSSAKGTPPEAAKFGGESIRAVDHLRLRRTLGIIEQLDYAIYRASDGVETLYARVPTLSQREIDGYNYGNATTPQSISLLNVWPKWQDQHVWCHMVLARRARDAGIEPPGNTRVSGVLLRLLNEGRSEFEKIQPQDLQKEFKKIFGDELTDLLPVFREALMIRDYVEAQIAQQRAGLDEIALMTAGNTEEFEAEVLRLSIDAFTERARAEVLREHHAWRAQNHAGAAGFSTQGFGYDALEEAFDKNRTKPDLQADARFSFDVIQAFPAALRAEGAVPINTDRLRITYLAVRDEMFKAGDEDRKNIDARLREARDRKALDPSTRDWNDAKWTEWENAQRPEMLQYRSFEEAERDLKESLERENAVPAAQAAISALLRKLNETKRVRERELNADLDVTRKEQAVADGVKSYLEILRQRFTSLEDQTWVKFTGLSARVPATLTDSDVERLAGDFARELRNLSGEQLSGLKSNASMVAQDLERMRNDKRAQREEFEAKEPKKNDQDEPMTAAEIAARLRGFDLEIEAINEKIRMRDAKLPPVEAFVEALEAMITAYELAVRQIGQTGDLALRSATLRAMLVEVPGRLARFARDQADVIVPQSEIDDWDGRSQLIQADVSARSAAIQKDAADTRSLNLEEMCRELKLTMLSFGSGDNLLTWERVVTNESLRYLDFVEGARTFLEEPSNTAGKVSGILAMPGRGYLLLRLRDKTPKYAQGRADARELVLKLAVMNRARQLCVDAMREVRRDIIANGWDAAVARAAEKYGSHFRVIKTGWFTEAMDIPGIYSEGDSELLGFSSMGNASSPDLPLMTRLRESHAREGVTNMLADKRNEDPLRRLEHEQWAYLLARLTNRRAVPRRLEESALKESGYGYSPAEIWRNRHLAGSPLVRELITPADLLKETPVVLIKARGEASSAANEAAK
ncbi:MAG: hypothetical protein HS108_00795 [Planctomycetes bacterium]|nr:hypothetical protein [Planctomycetota bacterium]